MSGQGSSPDESFSNVAAGCTLRETRASSNNSSSNSNSNNNGNENNMETSPSAAAAGISSSGEQQLRRHSSSERGNQSPSSPWMDYSGAGDDNNETRSALAPIIDDDAAARVSTLAEPPRQGTSQGGISSSSERRTQSNAARFFHSYYQNRAYRDEVGAVSYSGASYSASAGAAGISSSSSNLMSPSVVAGGGVSSSTSLSSSSSPIYGELTVYSWGRGEDGQLGIGDTSDQDEPTYVDALRGVGVKEIACGSGHTVVLTVEGEVYTWGRGDDGRLGHGDNGWKYVPRLTHSLTGQIITRVTCGSYHTAAVSSNGDLFTWGGGMYGKLGHGNESGHSTPRRVDALAGMNIVDIACGSRHTAVVTNRGCLYTWGDKENGVAGHGDTEGHQYTPKLLERLSGKKVVQLSACGFHTGCLTDQMEVYTWGEGKFGRLGHGAERNCHSPRLVESLLGKRPRQIACGGFHSAVITHDGKMYTFGGGEHGQLGHGDKVRRKSPCNSSIAMGFSFSHAYSISSHMSQVNKLRPTLVQALENIVLQQITCGWSHSVALTTNGEVYTWGNGDHGKLGHGNGKKVSTPQLVEKLIGQKVVSVASYNEHTAALVEPNAILSEGGSRRRTPGVMVPVSAGFLHDMKDMVNEDEYSDVTFIVEGQPVYAHRAVLSKRCDHFAAMFRSGMRESEAGAEIPIPTMSRPVFLMILEYLYTDTVKIDIEHAVDLYIASDLYQIDTLRDMCSIVVRRGIGSDNATYLLQQAHDAHCQVIKDIAMEHIVANFDVISKGEEIKAVSHGLLLEILSLRP
ncbi:hypothetical protein HJC23_008458 [Cyclotella cryptica]|uniref:BTB domain-containing protein n=1 Tax=Cyclotella cryptica TaxID=29204 RepID=A0ABD3QWQ1_9STRA